MNNWAKYMAEELQKRIGHPSPFFCPKCGGKMMVRKNRINGTFFLLCKRYPTCQHTEDINEKNSLEILSHEHFEEKY